MYLIIYLIYEFGAMVSWPYGAAVTCLGLSRHHHKEFRLVARLVTLQGSDPALRLQAARALAHLGVELDFHRCLAFLLAHSETSWILARWVHLDIHPTPNDYINT